MFSLSCITELIGCLKLIDDIYAFTLFDQISSIFGPEQMGLCLSGHPD